MQVKNKWVQSVAIAKPSEAECIHRSLELHFCGKYNKLKSSNPEKLRFLIYSQVGADSEGMDESNL